MTKILMKNIILASKSVDRKKILDRSKINFDVLLINVDEDKYKAKISDPIELIRKLSEVKALHARERLENEKKEAIIIAADTVVVLDNQIIGKSKNEEEAFKILKKLSGMTHELMTAITITETSSSKLITDHDITQVKFLNLLDEEILGYIKTGEWKGRAGAYSLRDKASLFIESIKGSSSNVIGLPMQKFFLILKKEYGFNLLTES